MSTAFVPLLAHMPAPATCHAARCAASGRPASAPTTPSAGCWQTWASSECAAHAAPCCACFGLTACTCQSWRAQPASLHAPVPLPAAVPATPAPESHLLPSPGGKLARYDSSHMERSYQQQGGALDAGFELTLARWLWGAHTLSTPGPRAMHACQPRSEAAFCMHNSRRSSAARLGAARLLLPACLSLLLTSLPPPQKNKKIKKNKK